MWPVPSFNMPFRFPTLTSLAAARMVPSLTVRGKILAISGVLLLLFAAVLVGSVIMQKQSGAKRATIIDIYLPLVDIIADLDVATDEYELILQRLVRRSDTKPMAFDEDRLVRASFRPGLSGGT